MKRLGYVPALDGLRGVAILLVMGLHFGIPGFAGGFFGVDLFFVLSGFLITKLLVEEWDARGAISLRGFYTRRALRLIPPLAFMLAVVTAFGALLHARGAVLFTPIEMLAAVLYVENWARILGVVPSGVFAHLWSLSVEEHFYLVWPVVFIGLLRWLPRRRLALAVAILALLSTLDRAILWQLGVSVDRMGIGSDTRADALLVGAVVAVLIHDGKMPLTPRRALLSSMFGLALIGWSLTRYSSGSDPSLYPFGFLPVALGAAIWIVAIVQVPASFLSRVLTWTPLRGIGKISYALYLWHYAISFTLGQHFGVPIGSTPLLFGVTLSLLAALASWRYVEQPALRWRKRAVLRRDDVVVPREHVARRATLTDVQTAGIDGETDRRRCPAFNELHAVER